LQRQAPWSLEITDHSLLTARTGDPDAEKAFIAYLHALYDHHPLDLIVALGAPAVSFVQLHRRELFPETPVVFTAVEERRVRQLDLTPKDAVIAVRNDFRTFFDSIVQVLPDTQIIAVVTGDSPVERFWVEEIRKEAKPYEGRVSFRWYNHLSFEEILKNAAELPPHSAIFWQLLNVDAAGVSHEGDTALKRLYAVANSPIFSYQGGYFGGEIVGGPMHSVPKAGELTATAAIRLLDGENGKDVSPPSIGFEKPKYDWRQMQRWGIAANRLPPGSEISFREPSTWERYRTRILVVCAALVLQTLLIAWLLYEHWRRQAAELAARTTMYELMQMNRIAAAGEFAASIAHEVRQPLTTIASKSELALMLLNSNAPNIEKACDAIAELTEETFRAADIIKNLGAMFRKDHQKSGPVEINGVIGAVLQLMRSELQKHEIEVHTELGELLPPVNGREVQLRQLVLNLLLNAKDAMESAPLPRRLSIKSELNEDGQVEVSVEDSGPGISTSHVEEIFRPMFTSKAHGMGMGLSICRTIIEDHGGRIWATPGTSRGASFHFTLRTARCRATSGVGPKLTKDIRPLSSSL